MFDYHSGKCGKWILVDRDIECPYCGSRWAYYLNQVNGFIHCPNCGKCMKDDVE